MGSYFHHCSQQGSLALSDRLLTRQTTSLEILTFTVGSAQALRKHLGSSTDQENWAKTLCACRSYLQRESRDQTCHGISVTFSSNCLCLCGQYDSAFSLQSLSGRLLQSQLLYAQGLRRVSKNKLYELAPAEDRVMTTKALDRLALKLGESLSFGLTHTYPSSHTLGVALESKHCTFQRLSWYLKRFTS